MSGLHAQVLAALAMACHELVPPESLAPVLKQLVDQFINDRWVHVTVLIQPGTSLS